MKKQLLLSALLFVAVAAMAQQPVITFTEKEHNFGKIHEEDGRVTTIFEFKNEGMAPLVLSNVRASCGCTTPKWTREPVEPGQTGNITVTYNPNGRPGNFTKTITVTSNASEPTVRLTIRGEVIPRPAKPVNKYTVKAGDLSLKTKAIDFGDVAKGKEALQKIEYANLTDHEVTLEVLVANDVNYLLPEATLSTIQPNQEGTINVILQSAYSQDWGAIESALYLKVNGKKVLTDEYKIGVKANLVEDFSTLTTQQLQQAPIAEIASTNIQLGTLKAGQKIQKKLQLKNSGVNNLIVRRIQNDAENLHIVADKTTIKGGKSTNLKLDLTANAEAGNYKRQVLVITNDPKNSVIKLNINWTVE